MHCNLKTMAKIAAAILVFLGVAWFAFPAAQGVIVASAPILLALICPVMMIAMMFTMRGHGAGTPHPAPKAVESTPSRESSDVGQQALGS